nr:Chain B, Voltage-dependent Calcium Channel Gamma-2 Subunit [Mus musculus]
RIPSYRYRY